MVALRRLGDARIAVVPKKAVIDHDPDAVERKRAAFGKEAFRVAQNWCRVCAQPLRNRWFADLYGAFSVKRLF